MSAMKPVLRLAAAALLFASVVGVAIPVARARFATGPAEVHETIITATGGSDGVTVIPGEGRRLIVDSTPSDARVVIAGKPVGKTPWSGDWSCAEGEAVQVEVTRSGASPHTSVVACQSGTTRIAVTLDAAPR
jgi:hypothetical protein